MDNLGQVVAEQLITELTQTISLFPGSFKPPHKGHFEIVERISPTVDEVHVIIANNVREGYTPELSLKIWEQYKKLLPDNVKVYISKDPSPITEVYSVVKDKSNNYIVVYGKGEQDRYNSINENRDKYSNVDIVDAGQIGDISATKLREAIKNRNKLAIKSLIPEGIKVNDFLMNFQIHEIKVNTPSIFPSQLLPYKDKIDYYIKYDYRDEIGERVGRVLNYILQNSLKGDWDIPGLNSPQEVKNDTLPKLFKQLQYYIEKNHLNEDKIPGGLAKGKSIVDLAIHHGDDSWASIQFESLEAQLKKQLEKGIKVEMEHTTSKEVAKEIAMDHLWEDPKYYDKLTSIEENIEESKNLGTLYHFTNLQNASNIIKSNQIVASTTESSDYQRDFQFFKKKGEEVRDKGLSYLTFVSLTRDKLFYKKRPKISSAPIVRFELDGNKLSSKYKIKPFNYYADEIENETDRFYSNEGEERVNLYTKGEISNLDRYITRICVLLDFIEDNESYLKQAKELISTYPGKVISLYKEKPMSIEDYEKNVLPTIEPYRDEEFLEEAKNAIKKTFPLNESIQINPKQYVTILNKLAEECCGELEIQKPNIILINNDKYTLENKSYAGYFPQENKIKLVIHGRTLADSCRSLSHEIFHSKQQNEGRLTSNAGEDGDIFENEANSFSGKKMREFGRKYPEIYFTRYDKN